MSTVAILWVGGYNIDLGSLQVGIYHYVIEYANLILLSMLMAIFVIIDIPEAIVYYHPYSAELFRTRKHRYMRNHIMTVLPLQLLHLQSMTHHFLSSAMLHSVTTMQDLRTDISFTNTPRQNLSHYGRYWV